MTWLNWSLKLYSGLWTIPHLILTHNTQDFCLMNAYFICVIVHDQMWWVYSNACRSNPKRFLSILYIFESVYMLSCFKFLFNCIFFFFIKNFFRVIFARNSRLSSSRENGLRQNSENTKFQIETFTTVSRVKSSHEKFCAL